MAGRARSLDMLHGSLWDKIVIFALPLAFTGILQQLFNTADVMVLGRYVSNEAMASVGSNVPFIGLIVGLAMGLSLGANVVIARYLGMRDDEKANRGVQTAFVIAVVLGLSLMTIGELAVDQIMEMLAVPKEVESHARTYLRIYLLGLPFMTVYNFLAAAFRSKGDTQTPLIALGIASLFNIFGNLVSVLVFDMGIAGVALSTSLANALAASLMFVKQVRLKGPLGLKPLKCWKEFDYESCRIIFRIGLPAAIQSMVFSLSNLIVQAAINSLGPDAMAGSVAAFTIEINVYCFINAFGLAATTFISQNYGAKNIARCKRIMWISLGLNFLATTMMIAVLMIFAHQLLGLFSSNAEIIKIGYLRLLYVVVPEGINSVIETLSGAMRGYGYSLPPALVTVVCICSVRIIWVYTAFAAKPTFECLMMVYSVSWTVTGIGLMLLYMHHQKLLTKKSDVLTRAQ